MRKLHIYFIFFLFIFGLFNFTKGQQRSESDDFSYALKLYNEQFYDLAAQQFSRFVLNYPNSNRAAEAGYYSGMSRFFLKDFDSARIEFQKVAVDHPKHDRAADSWYMIGECYEKLGNIEEAAKAFEMVKLLHPDHDRAADSILRAGQLYQKLKKYEIAEQLYNLIQNRYIESIAYFPSMLSQGILYLEKGQPARAKEKLEKVISSQSADNIKGNSWFYLGEVYRIQGNFQQAILPYQKVIQSYKSTQSYYKSVLALSKIFLHQSNFTEIQRIISDAISNKPPGIYLPELNENLADAYYLSEKYALAGKHYQECLNQPDSSSYLRCSLKLAFAWQGQNNTGQAVAILESLIEDPAIMASANFQKIKDIYFTWLEQNGSVDQAMFALYALKDVNEFSHKDRIWLIRFLRQRADWTAIIREIQPAVYSSERFQEKDDFVYEMADAHQNKQSYEESARYYQMIIRDYPCSHLVEQARVELEYLNNHHLIDQSFGFSQLAILMGDLINNKDNAELQFKLGKIYYENLKNFDNALVQFNMALQSAQDLSLKVAIHHYIGLTYQRKAENKSISPAKRQEYLILAKKSMSQAMENISAASQADQIAWDFVSIGIMADNSSAEKQIGYYETLVQKYPQSNLRENWLYILAKLYHKKSEKLQTALKYYDTLISEFKNSEKFPLYLYQNAVLRLKTDEQSGIEAFKRIAGSYPYSEPAAKAMYNLGLIWEASGNYDQANQIYQKLLREYYYTDLVDKIRYKIGDTYLYAGKSEAAIKIYLDLIGPLEIDDPILSRKMESALNTELTFKLAKAYYNQNNWQTSRKYFIHYLSVTPEGQYDGDANYYLGDIYAKINDPQSAIASFSNVPVSNEELYPIAQQNIANLHFELQEYDQAAQVFANLASLTDNTEIKADILAKQIISLIRIGKKSAADQLIGIFAKSYKSKTDHLASFQFEFGNYYRKANNFNQAVDFFMRVKKRYAKSAYVDDADYYLALTYIALNRHDDAINILTRFAKNYPDSDNLGAVLNTLGSIYFRSEKYESAITSFKSSLEKPLQRKVKRQVMSNLIKAYTFVNFWDAALALAREYIQTYPEAADVIDKKILMGRAYVQLNQVDRAVNLLRETRLIADSEREPEIQFYIGDAYFQTGQYENAIAEFVKIPLLSRKTKLQWEASALYYSGQAYEKLGRIDEAKRMYAEIVKRPGIDLVLKKEAQKRIQEIE